ncbi:MAG: zf-HC2 domain-containing protein [Candidatus Acidiferrum sp.]
MPCELSGIHLHAYLDGELDAPGAANFERHLQSCALCAAALASEQALRQTLAASHLYEPASARLRQQVRSSLPATRSARALKFQPWRWAALAAGLLLALFLGRELFTLLRGQSEGAALATATVDAHLRSLQPGHLTDVQSTDRHTVKPWFDGKIEFAPSVRDFSNEGFPLLGGRLDVLAGRPVAVLVYARRKHVVNVFVMKMQTPQSLPDTGERQGYHWLSWQKDGLQYVAVSDVAPPDLQALRDLFARE